jgi:hypothetical protein
MTHAKEGGHGVRDDIQQKLKGGLDVRNSNNGELTPGKKAGGSRHLQTIRMMRAKEGGHNVPDNIQRKLRGGLNVRNSNSGELTPGKKQGVLGVCKQYA